MMMMMMMTKMMMMMMIMMNALRLRPVINKSFLLSRRHRRDDMT